jgi:hypothetical protein
MDPIVCKYVLTRINIKSKVKTHILQSNERDELMAVKGRLESDLPIEIYNALTYVIEEVKKS